MVLCVRVIYTVLLGWVWAPHGHAKGGNVSESCVYLYEKGVEAYLDNRFDACIVYFENAIHQYKEYTKKLQNCRIKCREEAELSDPLYPIDIDNLLFYERAVKATLCLVKCKKNANDIFHQFNVNKETEKLFEEQKPYEYLHICYFQNKQYQKAASAAFTYLVAHPDDKIMSANLKHYSSLESVDITEVVNFEAKDFIYLYLHGVDAYEKKDWRGVIENMEESLSSYLQSEEECRTLCEGAFDHGWLPDLIPSIANHFTYCLKCKQRCASRLNSLNGEKHDDLLPSHYHYLQFAQFKTGDLKGACASVASYLLFYPDDETMLENRKYYEKLPKGGPENFTPRSEAVHYIQRLTYERRILKYIAKEFRFDESIELASEEVKYRIVKTEKDLKGPTRFLSEGLTTKNECNTLINIANMFALLGDGYEGKKTPHTIMEKFSGFNLYRATFLTNFGLLNPKYLQLYLDITERAKTKVVEYFKLKKKLYFSYTQLVQRSPLPDSPTNRTDFSHPIHADNCIAFTDNYCQRSPPAFTYRDFSAIIFLNDNFDGGEFIFSEDSKGKIVQSVIKPKCGRMVAFSSGPENLHGVRAVKKGSRYALGLWFTHDRQHEEYERKTARQVLALV